MLATPKVAVRRKTSCPISNEIWLSSNRINTRTSCNILNNILSQWLKMGRTIEVVVKVTERCNINCSYCYVFNKGDIAFKAHPPYMTFDTVTHLAKFLASATTESQTDMVIVDFHGGEPLMMKKTRFSKMCELLRTAVGRVCPIQFKLQTNGVLIDSDWISIFEKYRIAIGVSLDGDREMNDLYRIDHKGNGTYDATIAGVRKVQTGVAEKRIPGFGILSVSNPLMDGVKTFNHYADELKVQNLDFLLPIDSHDSFSGFEHVRGYGKFLCDAFDQWVAGDNPSQHVRISVNTVGFMRNGANWVKMAKKQMMEAKLSLQ